MTPPIRPTCKHGHAWATSTRIKIDRRSGREYRQCIECHKREGRDLMRRHRANVRGPALVDPRLTEEQRRRILIVATRRARYSSEQISAWAHASGSAFKGRRLAECRRGHPFTPENTYIQATNGHRSCLTCRRTVRTRRKQAMMNRPAWVTVQGVRVNIETHDAFYLERHRHLRAVVIAAHPDAGGTHAKFLSAKRIFNHFMKMEIAWYAAVHLAPPDSRARRERAAPVPLAIVSAPGSGNRTSHEVKRRVASLKNETRDCACGAMFMVHKKSVRTQCDACLSAMRRGFIERARSARTCWTKAVNE